MRVTDWENQGLLLEDEISQLKFDFGSIQWSHAMTLNTIPGTFRQVTFGILVDFPICDAASQRIPL